MKHADWVARTGYVLEQRIPSLVTVKPSEDQQGHVSSERNDFDPESGYAGIMSARAYAIECYAGYAAETRFDPSCSDQALIAARSDYEKAVDAIIAEKLAGMIETKETLRAEAARFVKEHWNAIEALAKKLLNVETIDGEEAGLIVDVAREVKQPNELEDYRLIRRKTRA